MRDYLKSNDISIKSGTDLNSVMCDMMSVLLEGRWMKNWIRNLVIQSTITGTRKQTIAGTGILKKQCIPVMATRRWQSPETVMANMNRSSFENTKTQLRRTWMKKSCPCMQKE